LASEYEPGVFFSISVMLEMLPINLTNLSINSYLQNFDLPLLGFADVRVDYLRLGEAGAPDD
jgi:hypothetical protein